MVLLPGIGCCSCEVHTRPMLGAPWIPLLTLHSQVSLPAALASPLGWGWSGASPAPLRAGFLLPLRSGRSCWGWWGAGGPGVPPTPLPSAFPSVPHPGDTHNLKDQSRVKSGWPGRLGTDLHLSRCFVCHSPLPGCYSQYLKLGNQLLAKREPHSSRGDEGSTEGVGNPC